MSSVFVPFHDGLLDFDCQECGSGCCRQSGNIFANEKEREILVQENPFIRFFGAGEEQNRYRYQRPPVCWFLEADGHCEIQRKHGYALKPFVCRLHPFYVTRCLNEYVVTPSECERLCVTQRRMQSRVTLESVLANAQEAIDCGFVREEIDWPAGRLELERRVLAESLSFLDHADYMDFAACQLALTIPDKSRPEIRAQLEKAVYVWKRLLGIEGLDIEDQTVSYELVAMTSLLRVTRHGLRNMEVHRIPEALLALYVYMILFSKGRNVKRLIATYASVLDDIAIGLAYITEADLRIKDQPLEKRLRYIRAVRQMHMPGFLKTLRTRKDAEGR